MTQESRFPSFAAMRTGHTGLLRLYRDKGASPELLLEAEAFVRKGTATGVVIQNDDDRMGAQSLLDYWAAVLSRADRAPAHAVLEEFDEELVPSLPDSLCPYMGLESFGESRRRMFFGRERVLNDLVTHVQQEPFLVVMGALGTGKSSIVLGALVPALKSGIIPGSGQWRYYPPFVPAGDPLASLARGVSAAPERAGAPLTPADIVRHVDSSGEPRAVITVDRLEELFSVCENADKRDEFADAILALLASPRQHIILATMRSDFEAQLASIPRLYERFKRAQFRLPPLSAAELRDAICGPAEQVGLKFEEGLVDRLVKDILGEPAGLPLLQFTLLRLWDLRDRNRITLDAYRKIGGGRLALARTADELYEGLTTEDQTTLRTVLLLMARPGAGQEIVSKCASRSALYAKADPTSVDRVIERLTSARLIRTVPGAEERLEIAHEALLWNWPRLGEWLDEERISTRRRVRLTTAAEQWQAHGKDPGGLLRGSLLEEAKGYPDLTSFEKAFVEASVAAVDQAAAEREQARRHALEQAQALAAEQKRRADEQTRAAAVLARKNRSLRGLAALAVVLLVVAAIGWLLADRARREAVRKQQTVEALMAGHGVVIENRAPTPAPGGDPGVTAPAPSVVPPPPTRGAEPRPDTTSQPPPVATAVPDVSGAPVDPERVVSQVRLRAARRPIGREIAGTELPAYAFTLWVDGPRAVLNQIESVEYEFNHPTFQQKVQIGRSRQTGFRVGYTGWGCLTSVSVTFRIRNAAANPPHVDVDMCAAIAAEEQRQ